MLNDTDSYYHLAVAGRYAAAGWMPESLPWARFSLLREPFPDKEPLFHAALAPFAPAAGSSTAGGRWALALFAALAIGVIAWTAAELAGPWAAAAAPALLVLALDLPDRLNRLRPELFALALLVLAARAAARRADRALGALAFLFTLSYTAVQALVGLVGLWWLVRWRHDRRPSASLPLYAGLGVGLGLVAHPAFPANLELWAVQNLHLFHFIGTLGAGGRELRSALAADLLVKNLGFWLAAAVALAALARPGRAAAAPERALARDVHGASAVAFGLLYLAMWRFGLYFFPFALLALLAALGREGLATRWPLRRGRSLPAALAWAVCLALSLPQAAAMARHFSDRSAPGPPREAAWRALAAAIPAGARVAAPWGQAQAYVFFAPQALYLNFLDPVLMAFAHPREAALERALFAGEEPDLALAVGVGLDSDHLALSRFASPPRLLARAAGDPRLAPRFAAYDLLYRVAAEAGPAFWIDWQAAPIAAGGEAPRPYPRAADPRARALEGFVDARRVGAGCVRFERGLRREAAGALRLELAPYGRGRLAVDGRQVVELGGAPGAVLGEGARIDLDLAAGAHVVAVETCPDPATGRAGFFLVERGGA